MRNIKVKTQNLSYPKLQKYINKYLSDLINNKLLENII